MPVHSFSADMQPVRLAICRCFYLTGIYWRQPTGSCLGNLDPQRLSKVTADGEWLSGDNPSKEVLFHLALYRNNPLCKAVVHFAQYVVDGAFPAWKGWTAITLFVRSHHTW